MAPPSDSEHEQDPTVQLRAAASAAPRAAASGDKALAATVATRPGDETRESMVVRLGGEVGEDVTALVDQVVDGRYRLIKPLATGGMGSVWQAEQVRLRRKVAIKLMTKSDEELVERFRREAVALSDVSHPAIVEIIDFSVLGEGDQARGCLVMAFIDGKDLGDYLDEHPDQRLDAKEVRILMLPVVSALVELHANGIIHRDIKPDNVVRFVRADGRPGVKLVDFGIARRQVDQGMTASGFVLGTPPYLPPETMLGEKHTPLSDIYALGASMFEMITGEPPFGNDSVAVIMQRALHQDPVFPRFLRDTPMEALLKRMLAKIPTERPDAMQVLQALEQMPNPLERVEGTGTTERATRPLNKARVPSVATPQPPAAIDGSPSVLLPGAHPVIASAPSKAPWILIGVTLGALLGAGLMALVLSS